MGWYREAGGATVISVRLTPRADRDGVEGVVTLADGSAVLKARVRALPEDGAANNALVRLIAKTLDVPKSAVAVVGGASQRLKQVRVERRAGELGARLAALSGG